MASMRDLFPFHVYQKKLQRNFIKENIRNAKGCSQCIAEKKATQKGRSQDISKTGKNSSSPKCCTIQNEKTSAIKYNVKIVKRDTNLRKKSEGSNEKDSNFFTRGSQTEISNYVSDKEVQCQNCGSFIINMKKVSSPLVNENQIITVPEINRKVHEDNIVNKDKDSHQISHENEEEKKKSANSKNDFNLFAYKKGEIPKYLKERNAKLEKDEQERLEREKLEEMLGLKDPKCPLGHMLMPAEQLRIDLTEMETKFNSLIRELNRMPVSNDSFKVKQRSVQIEKELNDLENKIELYKSGKVFVKIQE